MHEIENQERLKICQRCILPETFPGISFNGRGICNHCDRLDSAIAKIPEKKEKYRIQLDLLIKNVGRKAPIYDVIMAYSGGKDSSYTLKLLKERYDLRILAVTFDNHFVSTVSWHNIRKVCDEKDVDHIGIRPSWIDVKNLFRLTAKEDIFPKPTLLRASSICTACIAIVKSVVLRMALEMSVPLLAFGWSPGQAPIQSAIMKTNPGLIHHNQSALRKALPIEIKEAFNQYFIPECYYTTFEKNFPYNIHPLAFFDYEERNIKSELVSLGWRAPNDTDTNSTNCLLNALANQCHIERHGFHPYVWEIANMVREGVMSREEGIEKIYTRQDKTMVEYAKERLGL